MKDFFCLLLLFVSISFVHGQRSSDPDVESKIQFLYELRDSAKYEQLRQVADSFMNHFTFDCTQSGRINRIVALSYSTQSQYKNAIKHHENHVLPYWVDCSELEGWYFIKIHLDLAENYMILKNRRLLV